ncbi:MAG: tyrosine-type recombinase/integrase [Clostridia bacterium]|nr:tyrosine-type recombinase/integrase [Clostridia bacterium]
MEAFLTELAKEKKENTLLSYRRDLAKLASFYEGRDLRSLTEAELAAYFSRLASASARSSLARALSAVKGFYARLFARGEIGKNPAAGLFSSDFAEKPVALLEEAELARLLDFSAHGIRGKRDEAMIRLLCETGMSVSELVSVNREDLFPSKGYVRCGTGEKQRLLPVSPFTMQCLEHCRSLADLTAPAGKALFLGSTGKRITRQGFWGNLKDRAMRMGIANCSPEVLRQSLAKALLLRGEERREVCSLLGLKTDARLREYEKQGKNE